MNRRKFRAGLGGFVLSAAIALNAIPGQADDIDIYLQPAPDNSALPLVVLGLDLNLDPTEIVCSNVLADPATLVGEPLCGALQQVAVLPVLEQSLGLEIGSLVDTLAGENSVVGGLLGLVGSITGITLTQLADSLRGITGDSGTGAGVALDQLDVVRLLLYRVVHQLVGVRLAIIANNANTCAPEQFTVPRHNTKNCSNGAFFLLGATELLESNLDATVDNVLSRIGQVDLAALEPGTDATPPYQGKEVYYELVRYLTDGRIYNANINADNGLPLTSDPAIAPGNNGVDYISPIDGATCETIMMVNILLTDSQADDDSDADILADPLFAGANADGGDFTWKEMIDHLATDGVDYNGGNFKIRSSFLINGLDGGPTALLSNLVGTVMNLPIGINPLAVDLLSRNTFFPVSADSATFAGPQTLFSRDDMSQSRDPLYVGLFKPDPERAPAWRGNLKKLSLSSSGDLRIVDALGQQAIGPNGNISPTALTFWTEPANLASGIEGVVNGRDGAVVDRGGAGMFLLPPTTPPTPSNPSGATGSGGSGPRIFYQAAGTGQSLTVAALNLNTATVDEARPALNAADNLEAAQLIAWARGYETDPNVLGDQGFGGFLGFLNNLVSGISSLVKDVVRNLLSGLFCNPILGFLGIILGYSCPVPAAVVPPAQPWLMGDVLHSAPLAIDYGSASGDGSDIRIFTGTNRGFLHQFRDSGGDGSSFGGQEVWRFAPRSVMPQFRKWRSNSPTAASRPYGVDGAPVAYIQGLDSITNAADGDRVLLYFGLRRGGKGYYALDVTNPNAAPVGAWQIEKTASSGDFSQLGLSFSTPRVGRILLDSGDGLGESRTVLIFGGGYDGGYSAGGLALGKDAARGSNYDNSKSPDSAANQAVVGSDDDEGNAVFIVDAETGALIWKAVNGALGATTINGKPVWRHPALTDSIASDVTALDTTGDGFFDRLYVGDTGGRVWRADIGASDPAQWRMAPVASLGRHDGASTTPNDRRFFERPDVVRVNHDGNSFFALVIGSGNRADPLNRNTENFLYVLKDGGPLDPAAEPIGNNDLADFTGNCATAGACVSLLDASFTASGWKMRLAPANDPDRAGEKALSSPTTIAGNILFTSYIPPSQSVSACTPQEGGGRLYAIDLRTGRAAVPLFSADGEPGDSVSLNYGRGTPLAAAGIPAGVSYIRPQRFLTSDFGITNVDHRVSWRTYWRERDGER